MPQLIFCSFRRVKGLVLLPYIRTFYPLCCFWDRPTPADRQTDKQTDKRHTDIHSCRSLYFASLLETK